jgi:hypothetical protein
VARILRRIECFYGSKTRKRFNKEEVNNNVNCDKKVEQYKLRMTFKRFGSSEGLGDLSKKIFNQCNESQIRVG